MQNVIINGKMKVMLNIKYLLKFPKRNGHSFQFKFINVF